MTDAPAPMTVDERVAELLGRMTRQEKLAQLGSVWAFQVVGPDGIKADRLPQVLGAGIGQITRLAGSTNLGPREVARRHNEIQRFLIEETRLGIPAIVHEESLHGLMARGAPCFQQSIGAGATWDPELVEQVAGTIRERMLATGARHALAPVLDIARDPRWGRIEETYGEDPYLAAVIGGAYVRGLQGDDLTGGVVATGKHMVGHGLAEGGLNQAPAHVGPREVRDEQLFAFEAAVREIGLASVMPAYCDVDGVPCHASVELFRTILRTDWGFDGIVASDYMGIEMLSTLHHMTEDTGEAAALALRAGVDVELPQGAAYGEALGRALDAGRVDESLVDETVARILRLKARLGLFEQPYVEEPSMERLDAIDADEQRLSRELAVRSIVMLENDGVLPLRSDLRRLAVIGPAADSARELIGDYSHVIHIETLLEMRDSDNPFGFPLSEELSVEDELAGRSSIVDALRRRLPKTQVRHVRGCGLQDGTDAEMAEAIDAAREADVAIVVVGERSGLTHDATAGESRDRRDITLLGRQAALVEAVADTGTPVVLVVVSGRPPALEQVATRCSAIMVTWLPGDAGPDAIADVVLGDRDPGGKLPVTFLRHVGQAPLTYRHHPSGGRSQWKGDYADGPVSPMWPFGFGRSYTRFELSGFDVAAAEVATDHGEVEVSAIVENVGERTGDEVVQLYVRDEEATVARPIKELIGFQRVTLAPRARARVSFRLDAEQFAYHDVSMHRVVEPGNVSVFVGTSSADSPLRGSFRLVGDVVEVLDRRRYFTRTSVDMLGGA